MVQPFSARDLLECAVRGLGESFIGTYFLQPGLKGRHNHGEGIASREKLFRRVRHPGNLDQSLAQLRRVTLLRTVVGRPHLLDLPSAA